MADAAGGGQRQIWHRRQQIPYTEPRPTSTALPVTVVDPVGADAFAGTYCALRAFGETPLTAGLVAAEVAARVVSTAGDLDGLPSAAEVQRLFVVHRP